MRLENGVVINSIKAGEHQVVVDTAKLTLENCLYAEVKKSLPEWKASRFGVCGSVHVLLFD